VSDREKLAERESVFDDADKVEVAEWLLLEVSDDECVRVDV
jgi:hypothetical protein